MQFLFIIVVGAAAGFLATRMMKLETDVVATVAIGVFGALIGGIILRILTGVFAFGAGFVGAILGAMLLIWIWRTYLGGKK